MKKVSKYHSYFISRAYCSLVSPASIFNLRISAPKTIPTPSFDHKITMDPHKIVATISDNFNSVLWLWAYRMFNVFSTIILY